MSVLPEFSSISYNQLEKRILSDLRPEFVALLDSLTLKPPDEEIASIRAELIAFHDFFQSTVLAIEEEITELFDGSEAPLGGPAPLSTALVFAQGTPAYLSAIDLIINHVKAGKDISEIRNVILTVYDSLSSILMARISILRAANEGPPTSTH